MDGVLVDTSPCHAEAYRQLWDRLGVDAPPYSDLAGRSTREVIDRYGAHLSQRQRDEAVAFKQTQALSLLATGDIVYQDTVTVLKTLHANNIKLALATSASANGTQLVLERLGVSHLFDVVITSEQVKRAKPDPDIFLNALARLQLPAVYTIIVEDSEAGIRAGLASNMKVVNVRQRIEGLSHPDLIGYFDSLSAMMVGIFGDRS